MHRSGTSAITRALPVAGVDLGDDLLPAVPGDNDAGYWEDRAINRVNIDCLSLLGMEWDDLGSISPTAFTSARLQPLAELAAQLLDDRLRRYRRFAIKDPRMCRLLGFWKPVFDRLSAETKYVICTRNPLSVAESLERRGTTEPQKAHLLWYRHLLPSLRETAGHPRVVVDYDRLLDQPEQELRRVFAHLGLLGRIVPTALEDYCERFLNPALRHSWREPPEPSPQSLVLDEVVRLYALTLDLATDAKEIEARQTKAKLAALAKRLRALSPILDLLARTERAARDARVDVDTKSAALSEVRVQLADVRTRYQCTLTERDRARAERDRARAERNQLRHEKGLALADWHAADTDRQHAENALAFLSAERAQLLSSTSWRLTAPLRITSSALARVAQLPALLRRAKSIAGDGKALLPLALRVLREEGLTGLRRRFGLVHALEASDGAAFVPVANPPVAPPRHSLVPHQASVDIIVCIHNALDDVKRCLTSLLGKTTPPYRLILVDDGSDEQTRAFLDDFLIGQPVHLIRHPQPLGYTLAANAGLRASSADFVVLLNSDTQVTDGWLDRMIVCASVANDVGLIGPLSNTASWQSAPEIFASDGDWAKNPLPVGYDLDQLASLIAISSAHTYPRVGFLNGFCLLVKRALIDDIGLLDEATFGAGFGEENDYCLRAAAAGWSLAVADDTYIYHAQSKSYSHERRQLLASQADKRLRQKHADQAIMLRLSYTRDHPALSAARAAVSNAPARAIARAHLQARHAGRRMLFILPIASPGGGANVVITEAELLARCGVSVELLNLTRFKSFFEASYPDLKLPVRYLDALDQVPEIASHYDALVATVYHSAACFKDVLEEPTSAPVLGYYAQDFEPNFFAASDPRRRQAIESYSIAGINIFTKTEWTRALIAKETGAESISIGPSLDTQAWSPPCIIRCAAPVHVVAMVRPTTPRRAPQRTASLLQALTRERGSSIQIEVFGLDTEDTGLLGSLADAPNCRVHHVLGQRDMRALLERAHLFLDLSDYQAMGLTCMEAMACGVAVVGPLDGGLAEIIRHGHSGLLVDTRDEAACLAAALELIDRPDKRAALVEAALVDIAAYPPESAALRMMDYLFPSA